MENQEGLQSQQGFSIVTAKSSTQPIPGILKGLYELKYPLLPLQPARPLIDVSVGSSEHSEAVRQLLMQKGFSAIRKIRGDGNCFVRAVAFQRLANIQGTGIQQCFPSLNRIQLTACVPSTIPRSLTEYYNERLLRDALCTHFSSLFKKCLNRTGTPPNRRRALNLLLSQNHWIDFIVILYFRAVVFAHMTQKHRHYEEFAPWKQLDSVLRFGQESEGVVIHGVLQCLDLNATIVEARMQQKKWNLCPYLHRSLEAKDSCALLLYDKHYDLLQSTQSYVQELTDPNDTESPFNNTLSLRLCNGICLQCGYEGIIRQNVGLCEQCFASQLELESKRQCIQGNERKQKGGQKQAAKLKQSSSFTQQNREIRKFECPPQPIQYRSGHQAQVKEIKQVSKLAEQLRKCKSIESLSCVPRVSNHETKPNGLQVTLKKDKSFGRSLDKLSAENFIKTSSEGMKTLQKEEKQSVQCSQCNIKKLTFSSALDKILKDYGSYFCGNCRKQKRNEKKIPELNNIRGFAATQPTLGNQRECRCEGKGCEECRKRRDSIIGIRKELSRLKNERKESVEKGDFCHRCNTFRTLKLCDGLRLCAECVDKATIILS